MNAHTEFLNLFNEVSREIPFDDGWSNGTGYYDNAVRASLSMKPGDIAKCTSNNDRRMLIVNTRFGNAVVFERYSGGQSGVLVCNVPRQVERLYRDQLSSSVKESGFYLVFGESFFYKDNHSKDNIGSIIEELIADSMLQQAKCA